MSRQFGVENHFIDSIIDFTNTKYHHWGPFLPHIKLLYRSLSVSHAYPYIFTDSDNDQSDENDNFEKWNFKQTARRSRSLADLTEDNGRFRKQSDEVFPNMEEPFYVSATPPIPPPKTKSAKKKAERRLAVTSPVPPTSSEKQMMSPGEMIKLRKPKFKFDEHKVNWPGGRPPSMPMQMPPQPPMEPDQHEEEMINEENDGKSVC